MGAARPIAVSTAESGADLRLLLDATAEGLYAVDRAGVTTLCNAAFLRMMGFASEADAVGRKLHDIIHHTHPDGSHYPVSECPIYHCASHATPAHIVGETFYRLDGVGVPVEYWVKPIIRDGEHHGAICTFLDVTERRKAEEALRASESRFRLLNAELERRVAERAHDQGLFWDLNPELLGVLDRDARFVATNPAWQTLLGWSADEVQSTDFLDFLHPDDLAATYAEFVAIQQGRPVLRLENRYRHKQGGYHWFSWTAVPQGDRFYCAGREITTERLQAIELAERTAERDRLWSMSQDLLAVVDKAGVFQQVSPAATRILGYAPEEMIGCVGADFIHPDDLAADADALATAAQTDLPVTNLRYRHKDGSYRWMSWVAAPDRDFIYASGRHVTAEIEAQTALFEAQEALRQSQKLEAIGQLTGGVAHDFNNLLTVIRGSVELLQRPSVTPAKRERYLAAIADTADRAATLTGQLLAFARRQALKPTAFDVRASLVAMSQMIQTLVGSRVSIDLRLPDGECTVLADASQFDTAIVNMSLNARDAMRGEGDVTISLAAMHDLPATRSHSAVDGDFVAVSVKDTGTGIDPKDIARVFEPFFTTKGVGKGTGLGLSQVFGFAKQSGGEVRVESCLGEGSTFTLYLPRTDQPAAVARREDRTAADGAGTRVLVVEDNADVGGFARHTLSELGYEARLAVDGQSALLELERRPGHYHVVFSDVVMPGMSGIELAQEVRRRFPSLPVVLTSGYSHVLAQNGAHGFELLHKPYSLEQLSTALTRAAKWAADSPSKRG